MEEQENSNRNDFHAFNDLFLRPVSSIPERFQSIFSAYPYFNAIQSKVLDMLLHSDDPLVVSAPTGSGKTVIFELAIIRLLQNFEMNVEFEDFKVVYMAPVKALCSERYRDWQNKFGSLGVNCLEVTGDSDLLTLQTIQNYRIILTTPEKWDSMTRRWKDHMSVIQQVKLFLIDEVHLLNEDRRGPTLEAVVSRMKTVQSCLMPSKTAPSLRFIAVSATIPNIADVAQWLGNHSQPAHYELIGEEMRPVKLNKIVMGFPYNEGKTAYYFDMSLSYQLPKIIFRYSEGKPTLIFCSTRRGVQHTSSVLIKQVRCRFTDEDRYNLQEAAASLSDEKLREYVLAGVGNHHAGISASDRAVFEELFREGKLPILVTTSTLAMGVNLPAHLVIIKSTDQFIQNTVRPYPEAQVLQMIGRAGRPQFDTSGTAVIMTRQSYKLKYERLVAGKQLIESFLHRHLAEHLNAEVVLRTITDVAVAVDWIRSTFFYVRAFHNPMHYGLPRGLSKEVFESKLQDMCLRELNGLSRFNIIEMNEGYDVVPTEEGKLMARYYLAFDTMKLFMKINGMEKLPDLLELVSKSNEFSEIRLRVVEKQNLNALNSKKDAETIRFPLSGRIKTKEQKVNCLIQAHLGHLPIYDPSLSQEAISIMRNATRICKALAVYAWHKTHYRSLVSALQLSQSVQCNMWENSQYVARQLYGIGPALSSLLVMAGKTTFKSIAESNPRDLEKILNRHPPFGNNLQESVLTLPYYQLSLFMNYESNQLQVRLELINYKYLEQNGNQNHKLSFLIGGSNNKILHKEKLTDFILIMKNGVCSFSIFLDDYQNVNEIEARIISEQYVGVDVAATVTGKIVSTKQQQPSEKRHQTPIDVYMKKKKKITPKKKPANQKVSPKLSNNTLLRNKPETSNNNWLLSNDLKKYLFTPISEDKKLTRQRPDEDSEQIVSSTCDLVDMTASVYSPEISDYDISVENERSVYFQTSPQREKEEKNFDCKSNDSEIFSSTGLNYITGTSNVDGQHFMSDNNINSPIYCNDSTSIGYDNFTNTSNSNIQELPYSENANEKLENRTSFYSNKLPGNMSENKEIMNLKDKSSNLRTRIPLIPLQSNNQNSISQSNITKYFNNSLSNKLPPLSDKSRGQLKDIFNISSPDSYSVSNENIISQLCEEYKDNYTTKSKQNTKTIVQDKKPTNESYEKKLFENVCREFKKTEGGKIIKRMNPVIKQSKNNTTDKNKLTTQTIPDYLAQLFQKNKIKSMNDYSHNSNESQNDCRKTDKSTSPKENSDNTTYCSKSDSATIFKTPERSFKKVINFSDENNDDQPIYDCKEIITPASNNYYHPSLDVMKAEHTSSPITENICSPIIENYPSSHILTSNNFVEENNTQFSQLTPFLVLPEDLVDNKKDSKKVKETIRNDKSKNTGIKPLNSGKFYPLFIKNGKICSKNERELENETDKKIDITENESNIINEKTKFEGLDDKEMGSNINKNVFKPKENIREINCTNIVEQPETEHEKEVANKSDTNDCNVGSTDKSNNNKNNIDDFSNATVDIFEGMERLEKENTDENSIPPNILLERSVHDDSLLEFDHNVAASNPLILQETHDVLEETNNLNHEFMAIDRSKQENKCLYKMKTPHNSCNDSNLIVDIRSENEVYDHDSDKNDNSYSGESEADFADLDYILANKTTNKPTKEIANEKQPNSTCIAVKKFDIITADNSTNSDDELGHQDYFTINSKKENHLVNNSLNSEVYKNSNNNNQESYDFFKYRNSKQNEAYLTSIINSKKLTSNCSGTIENRSMTGINDFSVQNKNKSKMDSHSNGNVNLTESLNSNLNHRKQESVQVIETAVNPMMNNNPYYNQFDVISNPVATVTKPNFNDSYRKKLGLPPMTSNSENLNNFVSSNNNQDLNNRSKSISGQDSIDCFKISEPQHLMEPVIETATTSVSNKKPNRVNKSTQRILTDFFSNKTKETMNFENTKRDSFNKSSQIFNENFVSNSSKQNSSTNKSISYDATKSQSGNDIYVNKPKLINHLSPESKRKHDMMELVKKTMKTIPSCEFNKDQSVNKTEATFSKKPLSVNGFETDKPDYRSPNRNVIIHETSNEISSQNIENLNKYVSNEQLNGSVTRTNHENVNETQLKTFDNNITKITHTSSLSNKECVHNYNRHNNLTSCEHVHQSNYSQCCGLSHNNFKSCHNHTIEQSCHQHRCESRQPNEMHFGMNQYSDTCVSSLLNHCCNSRPQFCENYSTHPNYSTCNCGNCLNHKPVQTMNQNYLTNSSSNNCVCGSCKKLNLTSTLNNEQSGFNFNDGLHRVNNKPCGQMSFTQKDTCHNLHQTQNLDYSLNNFHVASPHYLGSQPHLKTCQSTDICKCEECNPSDYERNFHSTCAINRRRKVCETLTNQSLYTQSSCNKKNQWGSPINRPSSTYHPNSGTTKKCKQSQNQNFNTKMYPSSSCSNIGSTSDCQIIFSPPSDEVHHLFDKDGDPEYISAAKMLKLSPSFEDENDSYGNYQIKKDVSEDYNDDDAEDNDAVNDNLNYSQKDMFDYC